MTLYMAQGTIPQKRRTLMRKPNGKIYYEHYMSADGFAGDSSFLYRISAPSRMSRVEAAPPILLNASDPPIARNLLFRADRVRSEGDFIDSRVPMLCAGDELIFNFAKPTQPMERFYCNTRADELVLVVTGTGTFQSIFGEIAYEPFDLFYVPRGVVVRWVSDPVPQEFAIVETRSPLRTPEKFMKPNGQFDDGASYHERDLKTPILREAVDVQGDHAILMKVGPQMACSYLDHHPFDVVGWDGTLFPFALNMKDYEPLVGRVFLTPDQYPVFSTDNTMFTAVTPRKTPDIENGALSNGFHQNLDMDEVLFRFAGKVGETEPATGTLTLTPHAIMHGPKPGFEDEPRRTQIEWWGLMMDTRLTLCPTTEAIASNDASYAKTWVQPQRVVKPEREGLAKV
jgi:homogentisate 1,2-dioxygenase